MRFLLMGLTPSPFPTSCEVWKSSESSLSGRQWWISWPRPHERCLPRCVLSWAVLARMKPSVRLSVCLSVSLSSAWIVTKRSSYTYKKGQSFQFCDKKNGWWGQPLVPEILATLIPFLQKRRFSIVAPQT